MPFVLFYLMLFGTLAMAQTCGQSPVAILAGPITYPANHHDYYLLQPSCWTDAEATAVSMGGHLVSVNDFDEDRWIQNTFSSYGGVGRGLWIGLHDLDPTVNSTSAWDRSEEFGWVSGQAVFLHKWPSPGEPDTRPDTSEFYVEMLPPAQSTGWADKPNSTQLNGLVEVPQPLEITAPPQGLSVLPGGEAQLSVIADGTSAIRYQWQFMGTNLVGATEATFSITNFEATQAGPYTVVLTNDSGSLTTPPALLTVRVVVGSGDAPFSATNVLALACGAAHCLALRADGTVLAWGDYLAGQTEVPLDLSNVTAVAAGSFSSFALLADGTVSAWGDRDSARASLPRDLTNVVAISAQWAHCLALKRDGTVVAWNETGAIEPVPPGLRSVVAVAAGLGHALALKADGTVVAWGDNFHGQVSVPADLTGVVAVAAGGTFSLALKASGEVVAWGDIPFLAEGLNDIIAISACGNVGLGLKADGRIIVMGIASPFPPGFANAVAVAAGEGWGLALAGDASPHFTVQPPHLLVEAGGSVLLGAKAAGIRPMTYQWRLNGTDIPGATEDAYRIGSVRIDDAGIYSIVASNQAGTTVSHDFSLEVVIRTNHAPILAAQPDRTITPRTHLSVGNTATDPDGSMDHLNYRLAEAPDGASISEQGLIEWSPTPAQVPGRWVFTTVVTDNGSPPMSATNSFAVAVLDWAQNGPTAILAGPIDNPANGHRYFLLEPASWTDAEATAVALGGHLVTINDQEEHFWVSSTFSSYQGVYRALWIGLSHMAPPGTSTNGSGGGVNHLFWVSGQPVTFFCWSTDPNIVSYGAGCIKMVEPDPAVYWDQCEWAEEADSTPLNGVVELPLSLQIISQPQSVSVGIGREATLSVVADGTDTLQYQWQLEGTDLPGATTSSLILQQVVPSQSGAYRVRISNSQGTLTSATALVEVTGLVGWGISFDSALEAPASATNVVKICAGARHAMALRADGSVIAWGDNQFGQTDVPSGLSNVTAIAAGSFFSLALRADGRVNAWGYNADGETAVPSDLTNIVALAAGVNHSLAVKADGTLAAWGSYAVPPPGLSNIVAAAVGGLYDLALRTDGTLAVWGGDTWDSVVAGLTNVVAIAAGASHSLALLADGSVVAWGDNMFGATDVPQGLTNVVAISAGQSHSMALTADGRVVEWGRLTGDVPRPSDLLHIVAIAAGDHISLALLQDGAPHFTVQPWDQVVSIGSNPSLTAKAVGMQAMHYQWQFDGHDISGATADTYVIRNAQVADAGVYSLAISNPVGTLASRAAKLVVAPQSPLPPPTLIPLGITGGKFRLRVYGTLGPTYVLEASTSLTDWTSVQTNRPSVIPFEFIDPHATPFANHFYRVRFGP